MPRQISPPYQNLSYMERLDQSKRKRAKLAMTSLEAQSVKHNLVPSHDFKFCKSPQLRLKAIGDHA